MWNRTSSDQLQHSHEETKGYGLLLFLRFGSASFFSIDIFLRLSVVVKEVKMCEELSFWGSFFLLLLLFF